MFGYVRPDTGELKVREYGWYRAAYCGLCRALGRVCGPAARFGLTYDGVFLWLLRVYLDGTVPQTERHRCPASPALKCRMVSGGDMTQMEYTAAANAVLTACKLEDDAADETGGKKLRGRLGSAAAAPWLRRAEKKYPGFADGVRERLERLYGLERAFAADPGTTSADAAADAFGEVLAYAASWGYEGDKRAVAAGVGRHTGRWIYLADALDDRVEDARRGRFNAVTALYGTPEPGEEEKRTLSAVLKAEAAAAADALELADRAQEQPPEIGALLENILRMGLPSVTDAVLRGEYRRPERDSDRKDRRIPDGI